jgi:malonyl-CoA O-methyltransferase
MVTVPVPADVDEYFLSAQAVRRAFDAASGDYGAAAGVPREIRARLLERLDLVRLAPAAALDLGAGDGEGARALKDRYPGAQVLALDLSEKMLERAARRRRFWRRFERVLGDAQRLPLRSGSVDLVFSNLMLEWCADPDAVFGEVRRVLSPGGLFTFTTLGPDTLKELRERWRRLDAYPHVHRFIDMHDLGDALMRARFAEPVMDMERLTVTYASFEVLHRELRSLGSRNLAQGRRRGLAGRSYRALVEEMRRELIQDGVLPVSIEVVYGHAWAGVPGKAEVGTPGAEVRVPVSALGHRRRG